MAKDENEIGALWLAEGKPFKLSGIINGTRVVVFKNDKRGNEKAPDYRVVKSIHQGDSKPKQEAVDPDVPF